MKFPISLLLALLIVLVPVNCQQYYADIYISVDALGNINIEGDTNYPQFLNISESSQYTSKQADTWILDISTEEPLNYTYTIAFPQDFQITEVQDSNFSITSEFQNILVTGSGMNKPMEVKIYYKVPSEDRRIEALPLFIVFGFFFIGFILIIYLMRKGKIKHDPPRRRHDDFIKPQQEKPEPFLKDLSILSPRQKDILTLLENNDSQMSQQNIENALGIPKSSTSRNLHTLENLGLIEKKRIGAINYILLKKRQ